MTNFTPGPWLVHDDGQNTLTVHRPFDDVVRPDNDAGAGYGSYLGVHVAAVEHQNGNPCVPKSRAAANARLMAAAPTMLAELADVAASLYLVAEQLDRWAAGSQADGWSTHQVDAQRRKADLVRRQAAHVRAVVAQATEGER